MTVRIVKLIRLPAPFFEGAGVVDKLILYVEERSDLYAHLLLDPPARFRIGIQPLFIKIAFIMLAVIISDHRIRLDFKFSLDFAYICIFNMRIHIDDRRAL